jgi:hypothetical protein
MSKELKYELQDDLLERFTDKTNRSKAQTNFLYNLLEGNSVKLVELEEKLKNNFLFFVPSDKKEVQRVLEMNNNKCLLNLEEFLK